MSTTFRRYAPDQTLLLPADMREWLPKGHLAYHVSDLVDGLDLTAFFAPYAGDGRRNAPYAPRMMVKVLLYAYATGVFSSRGIARKLEEDVAFRVLAAGNFPQHRTLCEFRRRRTTDQAARTRAWRRSSRHIELSKQSPDRAHRLRHTPSARQRCAEGQRRVLAALEALINVKGRSSSLQHRRCWPSQGDRPHERCIA